MRRGRLASSLRKSEWLKNEDGKEAKENRSGGAHSKDETRGELKRNIDQNILKGSGRWN